MAKKKYKWITIEEDEALTYDHKPVYIITNNKNGDNLGTLYYYKYFKGYALAAHADVAFSASCLTDIAEFIRGLK